MTTFLQSPTLKHLKWAVIRLATFIDNPADSTSKPRLVFASVSLLADQRAHPSMMTGVDTRDVAKGRQGKLFFRRTTLTAVDAIEWYRTTPLLKTPVPSQPDEINKKLDGTDLSASEFIDDPVWPTLGVSAGADLLSVRGGPGDPAPFVGAGSVPARIHRRFGNNQGFEALTEDAESLKFLERRLHINLGEYPEYLGSVTLVVPDAIVKSVKNFIIPDANTGKEKLVYRVIPRAGQTLDGLSLTVLERHGNLLSYFERRSVPEDGLIVLDCLLPVQTCGYVLTHDKDGLLAYQTPLSFIRTVKMSMGIQGRTIKVQAPKTDSLKSAPADYVVSEMAHEVPIQVGERVPMPIPERIVGAASQRERKAQAKRYHQTWFDDGARDEALTYIRTRIRLAQSHVLVADPYFGAKQLLQFLHAVARTDISITILTSRLAFESQFAEVSPRPAISTHRQGVRTQKARAEVARARDFESGMRTFAERGIQKCSAFVLTGKTPPLHDRFLVIDDVVLFLGNSLNALGERASLILDVPDPEPIIKRLNTMLSTATPFASYSESRVRQPRRRKSKP